MITINIPRPQTKLKAKPYQNNVSLFSRFSTVVIAPIGVTLTPVRVCTSLLIHEYFSTAMTNLFITNRKLWPSSDDNIIVGKFIEIHTNWT